MNTRRRSGRGVSLVEALVALAVMGLGMLGVIGLQSSLRQNADLARQRSEALRLAQQPIEQARSYSSVIVAAGKSSFDGVVTTPAEAIVGTNATYTRTFTVTRDANKVAQTYATLDVLVTWTDRTNAPQQVRLSTAMHRTPPELSFALSVPGSGTVTQMPAGRHPAIPPEAADIGQGRSEFTPPQADGRRWIFNNTTGVIERVCARDQALVDCDRSKGLLLSGFVAFATDAGGSPTQAHAEQPPGDTAETEIAIRGAPPAGVAPSHVCFVESPSERRPTTLAYFCAIFVAVDADLVWSGQSLLGRLPIAGDNGVDDRDKVRVCRYTPYRNNDAVGSGTPPIRNADHPNVYVNVRTPLVNQNFLIIRAGNDSDTYTCPDDRDPAPDLINTRTWQHQPSLG